MKFLVEEFGGRSQNIILHPTHDGKGRIGDQTCCNEMALSRLIVLPGVVDEFLDAMQVLKEAESRTDLNPIFMAFSVTPFP